MIYSTATYEDIRPSLADEQLVPPSTTVSIAHVVSKHRPMSVTKPFLGDFTRGDIPANVMCPCLLTVILCRAIANYKSLAVIVLKMFLDSRM